MIAPTLCTVPGTAGGGVGGNAPIVTTASSPPLLEPAPVPGPGCRLIGIEAFVAANIAADRYRDIVRRFHEVWRLLVCVPRTDDGLPSPSALSPRTSPRPEHVAVPLVLEGVDTSTQTFALTGFGPLETFDDPLLWDPPGRLVHRAETRTPAAGRHGHKGGTGGGANGNALTLSASMTSLGGDAYDYYNGCFLIIESDIEADMRCFDTDPDGRDWRVGLPHRRFSTADGKTVSHFSLRELPPAAAAPPPRHVVLGALRKLAALRCLVLSHNYALRTPPVDMLLAAGSRLVRLDLRFNALTHIPPALFAPRSTSASPTAAGRPRAAAAGPSVVSSPFPVLEELLLSNNAIGPRVPEAIFDFAALPLLKLLEVENNRLHGFSSRVLAAAARGVLQELRCCNNAFRDMAGEAADHRAALEAAAVTDTGAAVVALTLPMDGEAVLCEVVGRKFPACRRATAALVAALEGGAEAEAEVLTCGACGVALAQPWQEFRAFLRHLLDEGDDDREQCIRADGADGGMLSGIAFDDCGTSVTDDGDPNDFFSDAFHAPDPPVVEGADPSDRGHGRRLSPAPPDADVAVLCAAIAQWARSPSPLVGTLGLSPPSGALSPSSGKPLLPRDWSTARQAAAAVPLRVLAPLAALPCPPLVMAKTFTVLGAADVPVLFTVCGHEQCVDEVLEIIGGDDTEFFADHRKLQYVEYDSSDSSVDYDP